MTGGRLADVRGRKLALIISIAIFGLFSVVTAWSTSYEMLVTIRFLTGLGLGGALPNLIALSAENVPPRRRNLAVSLMYCGMPLGGGLASLLTALGLGDNDWQTLSRSVASRPWRPYRCSGSCCRNPRPSAR
jgi:AAHS family 3-hydroxyphenylpropionic acid transporter